jgi:hypothetical protein
MAHINLTIKQINKLLKEDKMAHINLTTKQINKLLKPGIKIKINFKNKKYNKIYQTSETINKTKYGLIGFDELETNYHHQNQED